MIKIEYLEEEIPVYDITVKDNENFYANDMLVHNCSEILLEVSPMKNVMDPDALVSLCILSNVNAGKIKNIDELPRLTAELVRSLDNVIDIQDYPLPAAKNSTLNNRYLGIGVSDWAHYLTKKKVKYDTQEACDLAEEFAEHLQFNLLTASMELAKERGEAPNFRTHSKYADGWLPNDGKWRFIPAEKWEELRANIIKFGLRHLTLSAIPPAGCQTIDGVIQTVDGNKSIENILIEQGIDFENIQKAGIPDWIEVMKPFEVLSKSSSTGKETVNRIWYNGAQPTRTFTFEDGTEHTFTYNHKLKCVKNGVEQWIEVKDIDGTEEF